jgi:tetratricopeptide (TPR) repeat protein
MASSGRSGSQRRWAVVALCIVCAACRRDANANVERGDRLLATGQPKQAIVEFQSALNLGPNAHAERGLGMAYESLSAFALAERHLSIALEGKPSDVEARVALARVSARFGRYERARSELSRVLEQEPDSEPALLLLGVYADTRQQIQQAMDAIQAHDDRQKRLGRALPHEALVVFADLLARTNQAAAADALRRSLRLAQIGNPRLTLDLARSAAERERHELSRGLLLPLLERHPELTEAWQVMALSALELGRLAETRDAMAHLHERASDPEVRLLTARLGLASGLETGPLAELRALLTSIPIDQAHARAKVRRCLAAALAAQHKDDEARRELEALLLEQPGDVEGSLALAELDLERGRLAEAERALGSSSDQHGPLARTYVLLGRAQLGLGRLDAAEESFRRLWELAPHEPDARYWLALTLARRGQSEQARRLLEGNLERFPEHVPSLMEATRLLEQSAGAARAKAFLLEHGQKNGASAVVATAEADWLAAHGDTERALAAYRRALAQNPSHFAAVSALASFYARHEKQALARAVIDGALAHDPRDVRVLLFAARLASDGRRYDEARELSQKALEVSAEQPLALARRASIEAEGFRELGRAKALAERAYSAAPSSSDVLDALGWVSHLAGDSVGALDTLQRAAALAPDDPVILYHLGAALLGAGQPAAAHLKLARVLSLDPAFPTAPEIRTVLARR